jgi:hypothetical protein
MTGCRSVCANPGDCQSGVSSNCCGGSRAKDSVKQPASMRRPVAVANAPNSARVTGKRPIANGRAIVMAVTGCERAR